MEKNFLDLFIDMINNNLDLNIGIKNENFELNTTLKIPTNENSIESLEKNNEEE